MARREPELTPELILNAYTQGIFPMAETRDDPGIFWVEPKLRGVLPLDGFHISRSLKRRILSEHFSLTIDTNFSDVVRGCADREETWISTRIEDIYQELFHQGFAHSIEVWEGQTMAGGVYGIAINGAFFGESMFSTRTDASKVALAFLTKHLLNNGFTLFDTQFLTDHLASLGGTEISKEEYQSRLQKALLVSANFNEGRLPNAQDVVQRNSQIS